MINPELEDRCKHYRTTISSCTCPGFIFRRTCKHLVYKQGQRSTEIENIIIEDGSYIEDIVKIYGEEKVQNLIDTGVFLFNRNTLKLYNLR